MATSSRGIPHANTKSPGLSRAAQPFAMPDPANGVFAVTFQRGAVKVGKKLYSTDDLEEALSTVADLLAFVSEQVHDRP